jgi:hypothetical protein
MIMLLWFEIGEEWEQGRRISVIKFSISLVGKAQTPSEPPFLVSVS